jgi:hypothetical protein
MCRSDICVGSAVWARSLAVLVAAEAADYVDYKEGLLQLLA